MYDGLLKCKYAQHFVIHTLELFIHLRVEVFHCLLSSVAEIVLWMWWTFYVDYFYIYCHHHLHMMCMHISSCRKMMSEQLNTFRRQLNIYNFKSHNSWESFYIVCTCITWLISTAAFWACKMLKKFCRFLKSFKDAATGDAAMQTKSKISFIFRSSFLRTLHHVCKYFNFRQVLINSPT